MFARHTTARSSMKGSRVFNSIASWISKLHPQLPLSPRESQRLLTALTTSFRQQLDQSHPQPSKGQEKQLTPGRPVPSKPTAPNVQTSSFHAADKHLASMLTNPLLSTTSSTRKPRLDYSSARQALLEDPFQDTVALLEKYQESGAASVGIAKLCLQTYTSQLDELSGPEREQMLRIRRAGERTLHWLWQSGFNDTAEYVDDRDHSLSSMMVSLLLEEGLEEDVWKLLELDIKLGPQQPPEWLFRDRLKASKQATVNQYRYRWKQGIAHHIVNHKLQRDKAVSADSAIDALTRLWELKYVKGVCISFYLPASMVARTLGHQDEVLLLTKTDVEKYDKLIELLSKANIAGSADQYHLQLLHPVQPNGEPFVKRLRQAFDAGSAKDLLRRRMTNRENTASYRAHEYMLRRLVALLRLQNKVEDAEWVKQLVLKIRPEHAKYLEQDVKNEMAVFEERWRTTAKPIERVTEPIESRKSRPNYPFAMPSLV